MGARRARGWGAVATAAALLVLLASGALAAEGEQEASPSTVDAQPRGETAAVSARSGKRRLRATVRRSAYGIPHVRAPDIESLAAGYAWAYAEDNICTIANEYVTVNGQRSRYFGPEATYYFSGNGSTYPNLETDTYFRWVKKQGTVRELMKTPPPLGPKRGVRRGIRGYVAGYNAYLRRTGADNLPDERCRGADWVRPIRPIDAYLRFYQLGILASSGAVIGGITGAAPVSVAEGARLDARRDEMLETGEGLEGLQPDSGSNAYGFGGEATGNGRGLVLGNPHFPWDGGERLYQTHLTIPGRLDVQGASLQGVPLVLIGNTRGLAWSHTVATAWRFTPMALTLAPGDPHTYFVDGQQRQMEATTVRVPVRTGTGIERRSRTIHSTIYGPMIDNLAGIPLPWTDAVGFALQDVNASNFRYLNHFFDNNLAQSVREYNRIQHRYQGIPWVNSIAADSRGRAYYSMQGAIPHVPDGHAQRCNVLQPVYEVLGLPVLNGSDSSCDWVKSGDGVADGTFPPEKVPTTFRDDYVHNGNDSHWLANPRDPLEGYDRIIGIERAEVTTRSRLGLIQAEQRLAGDDGLPGKGFNRRRLERVMLGNRVYLGELWRDELVGFCRIAPAGLLLGSSGPVNVSEACGALARWDLRDNLDSRGAILFRRFVSRLLANFPAVPTGLQGGILVGGQTMWTRPFNPENPLHTPRGLNVLNPLVGRALADAVSDLRSADIGVAAPLGRHQSDTRGGRRIPIHGGPGSHGVFNAVNASWQPQQGGYRKVPHGASFIMAARFKGGRCPVAVSTLLTYGQSENQASPHASDYTRAYSRKRWNRVPFCRPQLRRDTLSRERITIPSLPGSP